MKYTLSALLSVLVLLTLLQPPTGAQQNDYLIVPGQRVGLWELGKPLEVYGLGQGSHWEGTAAGKVYYDGYAFSARADRPFLQAYTCRSDTLLFAVLVVRRLDAPPVSDPEELKYKTPEGLRAGVDESEVLKLLGRPDGTSQFTERHGQIEVQVRQLEYRQKGLFVRINTSDLKVFALGATKPGGFPACQQAALGGLPAAQPGPGSTPANQGLLFTGRLSVPMPPDLRIIPPTPDIPSNHVAFSGVWAGRWEGVLDSALAVVEIKGNRVSAVYAWGVAPSFHINKEGWNRVQGQFTGEELLFSSMKFWLVSKDKLGGQFRDSTGGTFTKVFP